MPQEALSIGALRLKNYRAGINCTATTVPIISTKPITRSLLTGLFVEDVRKMRDEIYARHGKVFKDQWTQKYFASFDWYKANPGYSDGQLSSVEKANLVVINSYEKKAVTAMSTIEG